MKLEQAADISSLEGYSDDEELPEREQEAIEAAIEIVPEGVTDKETAKRLAVWMHKV